MTVRQKIDQLEAEPPVRDLGYAADQRLVATALLGLQLLADEIDALKAESQNTGSRQPRPFAEPVGMRVVEDDDDDRDDEADIADIVDQLAELTAQMKKLTKAVKQSTGTKEKKPKK